MKKTRIAALGATILSLIFAVTISGYAQQQEEKPARQEDKAAQEEKHPQKEEEGKTEKQEEGKKAQHEDKQMGDQKEKHEASDNQKHEANDNVREGKPGARAGGRIPEERFHEHFGREHVFVINRPVIIEGAPRFQYGGYWFVIANPWPVGWAYTDQVYVDDIDGEYYILSPVHPGVRVLVNVVF